MTEPTEEPTPAERRKRSRRGRQARRKGAAFECDVAKRLQASGIEARRNVQARFGGHDGADIETDLPVHIECKAGKAPPIWKALEQAQADAADSGRMPVVIAHRDQRVVGEGATEVMVLRLEDGLRLLKLLHRRDTMSAEVGDDG